MKIISLALISMSIFLASCMGPDGPNGKDGDAYLRVTSSDSTLDQIWINGNSGLPESFSLDTYYKVFPGSYGIAYTASYTDNTGNYYSDSLTGTLAITVNHGTVGGAGKLFWQRGDPGKGGANEYYTLDCTYNGGTLTSGTLPKKSATPGADTLVVGKSYVQDCFGIRYRIHLEYKLLSKKDK
ncbi:MAG: hypothetical protein M1470_15105 [Bacteroidetes bacterium]|nr:hypothetical protein [Bacteroidota bacterium]MCL5738692.1 hypothetical protein [Bacteroidota bacterium]